MRDRFACLSDLNNYFKAMDLLSGLTLSEQEQLKKNIGIVDSEANITVIPTTYTNLNTLASTKKLQIGCRYIIEDYQTIYSSNVLVNGIAQTWGEEINPSPINKLVVVALTSDKLSPNAIFLDKLGTVIYDITQKTFPDNKKNKGTITFLKDSFGNSAFYDFKNIKFRRTATELANSNLTISTEYIDLFTFSNVVNNIAEDNSEKGDTKYNVLKEDCTNNVFIGDTYNIVLEQNCKNNTFIRGSHDSVIQWGSTGNFFNEPVLYTTGSISNKKLLIGNTSLSTTITKTIQKVNDATIISYLDPITYSYQVIIL